jgi:hypothetical protein
VLCCWAAAVLCGCSAHVQLAATSRRTAREMGRGRERKETGLRVEGGWVLVARVAPRADRCCCAGCVRFSLPPFLRFSLPMSTFAAGMAPYAAHASSAAGYAVPVAAVAPFLAAPASTASVAAPSSLPPAPVAAPGLMLVAAAAVQVSARHTSLSLVELVCGDLSHDGMPVCIVL